MSSGLCDLQILFFDFEEILFRIFHLIKAGLLIITADLSDHVDQYLLS